MEKNFSKQDASDEMLMIDAGKNMKAIFVANLELKETEGIFKKIYAESDAIGRVVGSCDLVTKDGKKAKIRSLEGLESNVSEKNFLVYVYDCFKNKRVELAYIRHMIPNQMLIKVLKTAKKNGIKIFYEIPTYPYFGEQYKASRHKHRAIIKILLDIFWGPLIYKYIDKLVVIKSSTKVRTLPKMVEINNGVKIENILSKNYNAICESQVFRMVAVGTMYPYHGYDRIIKGLANCNEKVGNTVVEFHVIGNSQTILDLQKLVLDLDLRHVKFHGIKTTEQLNEMYDLFDVGLGCLALHRRNADIDTTLKIVEYYCRGIPVVTSGISPMDKYYKKYTIHIDNSDEPIKIADIYNKYKEIPLDSKKEIAKNAKRIFSWDDIMEQIIKKEI